MSTDLKALARNKKAWLGVAAAAGLGALVWMRRRKSTSGTGQPGTTAAPAAGATAGTGAGVVDTTGTDLASFLGNWGASQNDQLAAALDQFKQTASKAPNLFSASAGTTLDDVAAASGLSIAQILGLNPNLQPYLKDANAYGYISPTNPANRPGGGPVRQVFWVGAPVKLG